MKLTKSALNKFIKWSSSRYNDYCGYGTKKENVDIVYNSLKTGHYVGLSGRGDKEKEIFEIKCASSVGESESGRYWKVKQGGGAYTVDCVNGTVKEVHSGIEIKFELVTPAL